MQNPQNGILAGVYEEASDFRPEGHVGFLWFAAPPQRGDHVLVSGYTTTDRYEVVRIDHFPEREDMLPMRKPQLHVIVKHDKIDVIHD